MITTMSSNSIGPLSNKYDTPSENVKKESGPLPKKSDTPSENVKKSSGDLDDIENPLVGTNDIVYKEVTIYTVDKKGKSKPNVVEESITSPTSEKKKIDTVNKTEMSQTSKKLSLPPKIINPYT